MSTSRLVRASAVVGAGMLFVMGVPGTAAAQAPPELNGADTCLDADRPPRWCC